MSDQRGPLLQAATPPSSESTHADRLRALLHRAELSQRGASRLLGIDERTMRMWCAGQGTPPESVYRALDPRLTHSEHLRQRIEVNERLAEVLESGRTKELPRAYQPINEDTKNQEVAYLRRRNEAFRSILRLDDTFRHMQDTHAEVVQQWLTPGCFGPSSASLQAFEAADDEFQSAKAEFDRITVEIRAGRR